MRGQGSDTAVIPPRETVATAPADDADEGASSGGPDVPEPEPTPTRAPDPERIKRLVDEEAARAEADDAEPEPAVAEPEPDEQPYDEGQDLIVCPMCGGPTTFPYAELPARLANVAERAEPWPASSRHATCPDCDGWGIVRSGARIGESVVIPCEACAGAGYVARSLVENPPPPPPGGTSATVDVWQLAGDDVMRTPPPAGQPPAPGMVWNPQQGCWGYPAQPMAG